MRKVSRSSLPRRTEREAERVLEDYRALDALASLLCQVGIALAIGGITIGIIATFRHHYLAAAWGVLPLSAGCIAGLEMVDPSGKPPTAKDLEKKRRSLQNAAAILMLSVGVAACVLIFFLAISGKD